MAGCSWCKFVHQQHIGTPELGDFDIDIFLRDIAGCQNMIGQAQTGFEHFGDGRIRPTSRQGPDMGDVLCAGKDFQMRIMLTQQGNGFFGRVRVAHGNGRNMGLFGMAARNVSGREPSAK